MAGKTVLPGAGAGRLHRKMLAVAMLVMGFAVACSPIYRNHGYVPTDDMLALIEVGTDTRDTVAEKVGRPSTSGLLNDVGWFYVQSRWREGGVRAPLEQDRQVVAISFGEAGTVSNVERFGLDRGRVVPLSRRVTDSNVEGVGFVRQLLGSIGKIRADNLDN